MFGVSNASVPPTALARPRVTSRTMWLLALTGVAFAVRAWVCHETIDVPGDGPTRAIAAFEWAQAPHVVTWGLWPPGLVYLAGLVSLVAPDPIWSVRLVNVVCGVAAVPMLFVLVRAAFTAEVAWIAAAWLAVLPLHVELSATSLAEVSFVLEMLVGVWLVTMADTARRWQIAAGLLALLWATMTRYEAWWFAPVLVAVAAATTRSWPFTLAVAAALGVFPVLWSLGNLLSAGDAFYGFSMARKGAELAAASPIGWGDAVTMLATSVRDEIGAPLAFSLILGLALLAVGLGDRRRQWAYAAVTATFWLAMTWFAMRRGNSVFDRYLLFGIVLLLPYAAVPWTALRRRAPRAALAAVVLLAGTMLAPRLQGWPPSGHWLAWSRPHDMQALVEWMRASEYHDDPLLLTDMGWEASYFALYWPEAAPRRLIVSDWTSDGELRRYLRLRRPTLLITRADDRAMHTLISEVSGRPLDLATPLRSFGTLRVHALDTRR